MPRKAGLILRLIAALPLWAGLCLGAEAQTDCARSLDLIDRPEGLTVAYTAPCDPYAALLLSYGALQIYEESNWQGNLEMVLPRLQGADSLTVQDGETLLSAAVPPAQTPANPFVAITWAEGPRFGRLEAGARGADPMGFLPGNGEAHLDLLVGALPSDVWLSVPITPDTCEQPLRAQVFTSTAPEALELSLTLPGCETIGQTLRIPLG